jgi:hypothetical protein
LHELGRQRPHLAITAHQVEAITGVALRPQRLLSTLLSRRRWRGGYTENLFALKHRRVSIFGKPRMPFLPYRKIYA